VSKVLVTGGAGYLGSVLVPQLMDRGYDVTVVDLLWFGNNLPKGCQVVKKSVFDLSKDDVSGFDAVVHLSGVSNDPMAEYSPARNFIENGAASAYIAFMAKQCDVSRFVYASSCSIYGYTVGKSMTEDEPVSPQFPYAISKLSGEKSVLSLEDDNFRPIALRKGTLYGWSPRMRLDLVVNTMMKFALTEGVINVHNPALWRPLVSIQDAAQAYIRALEADPDITGIFNVSYDNFTIGRVGDEVKSALKKRGYNVQLNLQNRPDLRNYKVDNSKAKRLLDFTARVDIPTAVDDILDHIGDPTDFDWKKKAYYNIDVFKELELPGTG